MLWVVVLAAPLPRLERVGRVDGDRWTLDPCGARAAQSGGGTYPWRLGCSLVERASEAVGLKGKQRNRAYFFLDEKT